VFEVNTVYGGSQALTELSGEQHASQSAERSFGPGVASVLTFICSERSKFQIAFAGTIVRQAVPFELFQM